MKTIKDLFKELALGQFSNIAIGDSGTIATNKKDQVLMQANEGLLRMYTRFVLKERDLLIDMQEGVTNYHLLKQYAHSNYDDDDENPPECGCLPYIMDLGKEPFEEDVVKVMEVWTTDGQKLYLNDPEQYYSVFTPQPNVVQIAFPVPCMALNVLYQAKHKLLTLEDENQEIELPDFLWGALKAYTAYGIYSNMNTQENTAKASEHIAIYDRICQEAIDNDLVSTSLSSTNTRFAKGGWI